jgi:predicted nucleic acid-binding protein
MGRSRTCSVETHRPILKSPTTFLSTLLDYIVHIVVHLAWTMVVKDSMVVIHLAKLTLLATSSEYFKPAVIPEAVRDEILAGRKKGFEDAILVEDLIKAGKLKVKRVHDKSLLRRAEEFNVQGGEAEALALYWQEDAKYLATDDDNVRKKAVLLSLKVIGTPAILIKLFKARLISRDKFVESAQGLRKIGWFSSAVIDAMLTEAT